jgi:hypothetical protein
MMPPPNDRQVIVRMPVSLHEQLAAEADRLRCPVSQLVRVAVSFYLDGLEENVEREKANLYVAAAQIAAKRGSYHGDMYGCVTCYHARTPAERCPEGQLVAAVNALKSVVVVP